MKPPCLLFVTEIEHYFSFLFLVVFLQGLWAVDDQTSSKVRLLTNTYTGKIYVHDCMIPKSVLILFMRFENNRRF